MLFCCSLPFYHGQIFANILEDAIIELNILRECGTRLQLTKTLEDLPSLTRLRFNVTEPSIPTEDIPELDCTEYKIYKIYKERDEIGYLFYKLYVELSVKRCFYALEDHVITILDKQEFYKILQESVAKNKILRKELHKKLRNQRIRIKTVKYDTDVLIEKLLRNIEDDNLSTEIRGRHIGNWENARTEQKVLSIKKKEAKLIESSSYYKIRADGEQRVHAEIQTLTNLVISDTLIQIEGWMDKYDTDIEAIDLKIQIQRNKYSATKEKRINFEQTIALHNKQIWDWNRFKEEREKLQLYHDTMQKSAIIVQAWWRGIIVRKQLGPFRQRKKKSLLMKSR